MSQSLAHLRAIRTKFTLKTITRSSDNCHRRDTRVIYSSSCASFACHLLRHLLVIYLDLSRGSARNRVRRDRRDDARPRSTGDRPRCSSRRSPRGRGDAPWVTSHVEIDDGFFASRTVLLRPMNRPQAVVTNDNPQISARCSLSTTHARRRGGECQTPRLVWIASKMVTMQQEHSCRAATWRWAVVFDEGERA